MAINLPGIDVGPTGSKAPSVGANGAVTASAPGRVPHCYSPTVKRLLAAGPTKVGTPAGFVYRSVTPRGMAAGLKAALRGIGPAAGRRRHSSGGKKVMRRNIKSKRLSEESYSGAKQP